MAHLFCLVHSIPFVVYIGESKVKTMKGIVFIEWEHGDADTCITQEYKVEDIDLFLRFIFDLRGWNSEKHYFEDDHYKREWSEGSELMGVLNKYNNQFDDYIPNDIHFSNYRPSINKIWLKIGRKIKYIVWNNVLSNAKEFKVLPKGSSTTISSGKISGYGKSAFGGSSKDYLYFWDLEKINLGYIDEDEKEYKTLDVVVKDVKILIEKKGLVRYRHDFTNFQYVVLLEHKKGLLTTGAYGYNKDMIPKEDFLYYFNG